jgi:hypothetical protein
MDGKKFRNFNGSSMPIPYNNTPSLEALTVPYSKVAAAIQDPNTFLSNREPSKLAAKRFNKFTHSCGGEQDVLQIRGYAPGIPRSTPVSVQVFQASQWKASRIRGGAPAAPRK